MFGLNALDRRRTMTLGLIALVVLLTALATGLLFAILGRDPTPAGLQASPSPSAPPASFSAQPSQTPQTASVPSDTAAPTASPAPTATSAPAAALPVESWIRTDVKLNMRRAPGVAADLRAVLEPAQVAFTVEGPLPADGFDWYRIFTPQRDGASGEGWIASGPEGEPFASGISSDSVLRTCGAVEADAMVGGLRFRWSLDEVEQAILDLLAATHGSACITLQRGADAIATYVDASVSACGEPRWEQGDLWLLPAVGGDVVADMQVKQRVKVNDQLLTTDAVLDTNGQSNRHRVMGLASEKLVPFGCVHARVTETSSGRDTYFMTDTVGCFLLEEATPNYAAIRARHDGTLFRLERRPGGGYASVAVGTWTRINVTALYSRSDGQFLSLVSQPGGCTSQ